LQNGFILYYFIFYIIKTTPAIFQQAIDLTFSDLPGIYAYLNDIVILDFSQQETQYPLALCKARLQGEIGNSELKNANSH